MGDSMEEEAMRKRMKYRRYLQTIRKMMKYGRYSQTTRSKERAYTEHMEKRASDLAKQIRDVRQSCVGMENKILVAKDENRRLKEIWLNEILRLGFSLSSITKDE